ncbi:MAG: CotH kinase family protein [Gemmataceae bacterium]
MTRSFAQAVFNHFPSAWVAAIVLASPAAISAADDKVFTSGKVWSFQITMSADEFKAMQPKPSNGGGGGFGFNFGKKPEPKPTEPKREVHKNNFGMDLPWATGSVTIGDHVFDSVGIRYKGNGTIGDAARTVKKSIKIDLDRQGGEGKFGGAKSINLHCEVTDPTKFRETFGYELYRNAGVPAPRTAPAEVRLTVPGKYDKELLGFYTIVEDVGKSFLRERFGTDKGLLMKPEGVRDFDFRGEKWDSYKASYKVKRDATKDEANRLIAFCRLVHKADDATFNKEIESYVDIDNYLRFLAVTAYIANTDSFFALGHNYCLYLHPQSKKLHFIPWDLDRSFSNFPIFGTNNQQMNLSFSHPYAGPHRLNDRLFAIPSINERYQSLLKELSTTVFEKTRLLKRLETAEADMKGLLERDAKVAEKRKDGGTANGVMFGKPPALKTFIEKRTVSLLAQVAGSSKGFIPVGGFGPGAGPPQLGPMIAGIMMEFLDTDKDEMLSREEWMTICKRLTDVCKKAPDGTVNLKSLTNGINALVTAMPDGGQQPGFFNLGGFLSDQILARADKNHDDKLTVEEMLNEAKAIFDESDPGKTGKLNEEAFGKLIGKLLPPAPPMAPPKPPAKKPENPKK